MEQLSDSTAQVEAEALIRTKVSAIVGKISRRPG
jgi:hypothetical protein